MSRKYERGGRNKKPEYAGSASIDQIRRIYSPLPEGGVSFEVTQVNLVDLVTLKRAQGIIFRSQPGGGKSHTIERFRKDLEKQFDDNVLIRSIKWSDRLRDKDILGNRKPKPDSLTPEKRKLAGSRFLADALLRFSDVVKKQRRGRRTHPRGMFTIAEVPEGSVDESVIQKLIQSGFLLIDLVPDPAFQRQAIKERQLAWDSETGESVMIERRYSAPPEVLEMSRNRARRAQKSMLSPTEREWGWISQVPVPGGDRRRHDDTYHMARAAVASLRRADLSYPSGHVIVGYNRRVA